MRDEELVQTMVTAIDKAFKDSMDRYREEHETLIKKYQDFGLLTWLKKSEDPKPHNPGETHG